MWRFGKVTSWRGCISKDRRISLGMYSKAEWVVLLSVKKLLAIVARFWAQRDKGTIDHTESRSPCMTWDTLYPVWCLTLLLSIWPMDGLIMKWHECNHDMPGGLDNYTLTTSGKLCDAFHGSWASKMAKSVEGDTELVGNRQLWCLGVGLKYRVVFN